MSNALVAMDQLERAATVMVKSRLFGVDTVEQAMSLMMIADAEGRHYALAARDYHVIKGRPALKADAMLARFQQAGGVVNWIEYSETCVTGEFSHPQSSPKPISITWTIEMAKKIGLANKDNWRNFPRAMLRARVISEGVRTVYPGISVGVYTVEEVQDFDNRPEKDITPTAGAEDRVAASRLPLLDKVEAEVRKWLDEGSVADAVVVLDDNDFDADERVALWKRFDSKQRSAMKKEMARQKAEREAKTLPPADTEPAATATETITPAQHKRLEARIKELGADRDKLKAYVAKEYGIEHLNALTKEAYKAVDAMLDKKAAAAAKSMQTAAPAEVSISEKITACQTVEELDALAETFGEDDAAIFFDAFAKRKAELAGDAL